MELKDHLDRACSVDDCKKESYSLGLCRLHYKRFNRHGHVGLKRKPPQIRFHESYEVVTETGCWLWTKSTGGSQEYGSIRVDGKRVRAHRYSWTIHNGPIPDGVHVLHKCDVPACVNPEHLFVGTHKDNMSDAAKKGRIKSGGMGLQTIKALVIIKQYPKIRPSVFSRKMWPDAEGHDVPGSCGYGVTMGIGMWKSAGCFLGKIKKLGLITGWNTLTEKGKAALRAIEVKCDRCDGTGQTPEFERMRDEVDTVLTTEHGCASCEDEGVITLWDKLEREVSS